MKIWVDAQISPAIAQWLSSAYGVQTVAVKDLGLRDAMDRDIFLAARAAKAVLTDQGPGLSRSRDSTRLATSDSLGYVREYIECKTEGDPYTGLACSRYSS